MKIVVQRSLKSQVIVDREVVGEIDKGLVLFICLEKGDGIPEIDKASQKIIALRIFEDDDGKMNNTVAEYGGEILAVSQFTLSWNGKKGNRPSFDNSMAPQDARVYFRLFCDQLAKSVKVSTGKFGAKMDVLIHNDGPVTFHLEY